MTNESPNAENPKNLPYRFAHSPITGEVYVISFGYHGIGVTNIFEDKEMFHWFLIEAMKFDDALAPKVIQQAQEVLKEKQGE